MILYFDCMSGVSGDMAVGALLDMGIEPEALAAELEKAALPAVYDIETEKVEKNGVRATAFRVIGSRGEAFRLTRAAEQLAASRLDAGAKQLALRILRVYAGARKRVYGEAADRMDGEDAVAALVNMIAAAVCVRWLGPRAIVCSPLTEGSGFAETRHGLTRLPVPAVMETMREAGAPLEVCGERTQLVTPTGAAIVCALAQRFEEMPSMTVSAVGFGAGAKDLDSRANVLRAILGKNEPKFFEEGIGISDPGAVWYGGFLSSHMGGRPKRKKPENQRRSCE